MDRAVERGAAQLDMMALSAPEPIRRVKIRNGSSIVPLAISWLWDGWLPAGKLTILAGSAGTGKTTLALGLAGVLTSGGRWPDGKPCELRGNVLIWSSEDSAEDTLVPRLIASDADLGRCHFIEGITNNGESLPFDPSQDMNELHIAVERIGGVSLLLIDPIVSAISGDMHRANDVRRSLQAVVDFAAIHKCAVIGITHFAKGGAGKTPQDRVIGSQAFGALARMVLVAGKEEDGDRRVLARAKSNIASDDGGVAYSIDLATIDCGIETVRATWQGTIEGSARDILGDVEFDENNGSSKKGERTGAVEFLANALNNGPVSARDIKSIALDTGYSWATVRRAKDELEITSKRIGGAGRNGFWEWSLLSADRALVIPTNANTLKKP